MMLSYLAMSSELAQIHPTTDGCITPPPPPPPDDLSNDSIQAAQR